MAERELHLTARNAAFIEKAASELAARFGLDRYEVRTRILAIIAPYPPREQCKEAIAKVHAQLAAESPAPPDSSGKDA